MDTRLRSISRNKLSKLIAFFSMIALIIAIVLQGQYILFLGLNPEVLFTKEYKHSNEFQRQVRGAIYRTTAYLEYSEEILMETIEEAQVYYYYVSDGKNKTYSNIENPTKEFFKGHKEALYIFEKGHWELGEDTIFRDEYLYDMRASIANLYIAFPDEYMKEMQTNWENQGRKLTPLAMSLLFTIILAVILMIYQFIVAGRRPEDQELHGGFLDKVYSDILALAFLLIVSIWLVHTIDSFPYSYMGQIHGPQIYYMLEIGILTFLASGGASLILLSFARRIKAKKLIKYSLTYKIYHGGYDFVRSIFDGRRFERYPLTKSLFYRQMIFIVTSLFLVLISMISLIIYYDYYGFPWFILTLALELPIIYWYIKGNNKTFEDINKGFNESLEEQMKAERMKINLITNVSHDLKTPLTSIISYVDLLSKEEGLSDSAKDYVKILSDKSNSLKQIVADLFDLAKSTSGDIHLDLETLDMKKLIEQTLGDMEDEIRKSGFQVRVNIPEGPVNILSDGNKLYRVFQNILDNALKYSLEGTRIFIDLEELDGRARVTIKNIAGYEMNFSPEDILQRFSRGDESRTSEGSGLGLSIAESFTEVSGGSLKIDIDGDLFKVIIVYPMV